MPYSSLTVALVTLAMYRITGMAAAAPTIPVILDTDIGTFIDDSFALASLLAMPQVDLKLVLTASHDVVGRARVAAKYLSSVGADHVPIGVGVPTDAERGALFGWADGYDLASYRGGVHFDGVAAMAAVIDAHPETVLIEIGPHTNARALIERHPDAAARVRVAAMGGSVVPGIVLPWGPVTPVATTNEAVDVPAARALLGAAWVAPVQWAAVATSAQVVIGGSLWQDLTHSTETSVRVLLDCYRYWWNASRSDPSWITHGEAEGLDPAISSAILWDTEAVHLATSSQWLHLTQLTVNFSDDGHTRVLPADSSQGAASLFALNWTSVGAGEEAEGDTGGGLTAFLKHLTSLLLTGTGRTWPVGSGSRTV